MDVAAFPPGYLSLISSQNSGQGIRQAADYVTPSLELAAFLGAGKRDGIRGLGPLNAVGLTPFATIPAGEVWVLRAGSIELHTNAGATISGGGLVIRLPTASGGGFPDVILASHGAMAASQDALAGWTGELILLPNTLLGVLLTNSTGVPTGGAHLLFDRLRL